MARQAGNILIEGTLDDLTFYKMYGKHYVRMKSSLTRKKVLKSPRFALTRMHANQLAEASRIASGIYKQIPKEDRNIQLFRSIVGKAKVLLAEGKEKEVVRVELESLLIKDCFEYRKRNKEQMNVEVNSERTKVKGESIVRRETSDVRKREYFIQRSKGSEGAEVAGQTGFLLVNEVGRLIDENYTSTRAGVKLQFMF